MQNVLPSLTLLLILLLMCIVLAKRRSDDSESWTIDAPAEPEPWYSSGKPADYLLPPTQSAEAANMKIRGKDMRVQDFLEGHHFYSEAVSSAFSGETLLYVTPWNQRGYDLATLLQQQNKLTWLAPVWYQIRKEKVKKQGKGAGAGAGEEVKVTVAGDPSEADLAWLRSFHRPAESCESEGAKACQQAQQVQLVPRVALECSLDSREEMQQAAEVLLRLLLRLEKRGHKVHGFTLEVPFSQAEAAITIPQMLRSGSGRGAGEGEQLKIIMVLPPVVIEKAGTEGGEQAREVLDLLAASVDRLSVMTYDKSRDGSPISPLPWVREVLSALAAVPSISKKLLLGLPFYGWTSDGEDLTAEKMVGWLATDESVKVVWDEEAEEHRWSASSGVTASFPTPYMLQRRLELAKELGLAGVGIWEGGQGIAAAVDLL